LDLSDLDQRTNAAKLAQQVKANIIADLGGEESEPDAPQDQPPKSA
jgi:hypothetical protein